jgi:hypothetical protein
MQQGHKAAPRRPTLPYTFSKSGVFKSGPLDEKIREGSGAPSASPKEREEEAMPVLNAVLLKRELSEAKFIAGPDTGFRPRLFSKKLVNIQHIQEEDGSDPHYHLVDRFENVYRLYTGPGANMTGPGLDIAKQVHIEFKDGTRGTIVPVTFPKDKRSL